MRANPDGAEQPVLPAGPGFESPAVHVNTHITDNAACRPNDWPNFVSEDRVKQAQARLICAGCPVREACLTEFFLDQGVTVGGTTWHQRVRSLQDGDYPEAVHKRLDDMFARASGLYRVSGMGLSHDLVAKLRARHEAKVAAA